MAEIKLKALEWNPFRAETSIGAYRINEGSDGKFWLWGVRGRLTNYVSLDAAKAAAEADYTARIVSAIEPIEPDAALTAERTRAENTEAEVARLTLQNNNRGFLLGPLYRDATELSGFSWNGFNLLGDRKSIKEAKKNQHYAAQLDEYQKAFTERTAALNERAEKAEARADILYRILIDTGNAIGAGLGYGVSDEFLAGLPKEARLSREKAEKERDALKSERDACLEVFGTDEIESLPELFRSMIGIADYDTAERAKVEARAETAEAALVRAKRVFDDELMERLTVGPFTCTPEYGAEAAYVLSEASAAVARNNGDALEIGRILVDYADGTPLDGTIKALREDLSAPASIADGSPHDAGGERESICDHCAKEVAESEVDDCEPDETGHCILCGRMIAEPSP